MRRLRNEYTDERAGAWLDTNTRHHLVNVLS